MAIITILSGCTTLDEWNQKIPNNEPNECATQIIENIIYLKATGTTHSFKNCEAKPEKIVTDDKLKPANK